MDEFLLIVIVILIALFVPFESPKWFTNDFK